MIRTAIFFLVFWLYQILILPLLATVLLLHAVGRRGASRRMAGAVARNWARTLLGLAGCRCRIHGAIKLPEHQAALYVSNHQGAFDIPLVLARLGRPLAFVAKVELTRIPLLSMWMKYAGCVFLDRGDQRQSLATVKQAIAHLQEGLSMVVFPEGTRSNSPVMGEFKKGSLGMAVRAGVPIVPVSLSGTYNLLKGDSGIIQPAVVDLVIHDPIFPEQLTQAQLQGLTEMIKDQIQNGLDQVTPGASNAS